MNVSIAPTTAGPSRISWSTIASANWLEILQLEVIEMWISILPHYHRKTTVNSRTSAVFQLKRSDIDIQHTKYFIPMFWVQI